MGFELTPVTTDAAHAQRAYDLAIVGSGISCAFTLMHYASLLEVHPPAMPVRAVVLEKSGELWAGVPYGGRAGRDALMLTPLREHLTDAEERARLAAWLCRNFERVFDTPDENERALGRKWWRTHEGAMRAGRWDDLFVPRIAFGRYVQERMDGVLRRAADRRLLTVRPIADEVLDVERAGGLYRIESALTQVYARKVLLAIGSPPNKALSSDAPCCIRNLYEPSANANVERIVASLRRIDDPARRRVLVVGSKAGALDALYCLANAGAADRLVTGYSILSRSGLPYRLKRERSFDAFEPDHLIALARSEAVTARQILDAVKADIAGAVAREVSVADVHGDISKAMMAAVDRLDPGELERFVTCDGDTIGRVQRRAGADYMDMVDALNAQGRIEIVEGTFGGTTRDARAEALAARAAVVINCSGFESVTDSSVPLIRNLVRRGLCMPNASGRGFAVNAAFETSPDCHLVGPLLAGNANAAMRVWQAENCSRLFDLSRRLAQALAREPVVDIRKALA